MHKGVAVIIFSLLLAASESSAEQFKVSVGPKCRKFFSGDAQVSEVSDRLRCRVRVEAMGEFGEPVAGSTVELTHKLQSLEQAENRSVTRLLTTDKFGETFSRVVLRPGYLSRFKVEETQVVLPSCGNGLCEDVVCLAIGCPDPETEVNCPLDCDVVWALGEAR